MSGSSPVLAEGILLTGSSAFQNCSKGEQKIRLYIYYIHIYLYIIYIHKSHFTEKKTQPSLQQTLLKTMSNVKVFELEVQLQVHNFIN